MEPLSRGATVADFQRYVAKMETERGFTDSTVLEQCLKLGEEYGELCKAIRKRSDLPVDRQSVIGTVDEELADVFIYLLAIANRYNIDLEDAFRRKEERNEARTWN